MLTDGNIDDLRRKVLVGQLPMDFLRLSIPVASNSQPTSAPEIPFANVQSFAPPNTRGRLSVTILDANLVKNYGLVRMDPYCRLRVGHAVFETQTRISGGRNPDWNRTVHAYLPNGVESIYIQVFDEKAFTADECIAWAHLMLPQSIFNNETIDEYYALSGQQGEGKEGMIHLAISFAPLDPALTPSVQGGGGVAAGDVGIRSELTATEDEMKDLADMFPTIEKDVIACVLEECRGSKDAAVSSLLEMSSPRNE